VPSTTLVDQSFCVPLLLSLCLHVLAFSKSKQSENASECGEKKHECFED
tara:strand:+ start:398 stop:544 length:147 start_codon:yes stop_codon:yes gene_type:complete